MTKAGYDNSEGNTVVRTRARHGQWRRNGFTLLSGLVAASLALTACSSSNGAAADKSSGAGGPSASGSTSSVQSSMPSGEISFANPDLLQPVRGDALWAVIADYQKANPNVKMVKVDPPYAQFTQVIDTQFGAGGGPDIFTGDVGAVAKYFKSGLLVALDDVFPAGTLNSTADAGKVNGVLYGVPFQTVNYALIWNKSLIAKAGIESPPKTFDELLADAKQCKEKLGVIGFAGRSQMNEMDGWWTDFNAWVQGFGGAMAKDGKLTLNAPENIAAVTAFKQMYDSGAFSVGDDASTFRLKFGQGQVCFAIENSASANIATTNTAGHLAPDNLGVSKTPFPTTGYAVIPQMLLVNKHSKNLDAVKAFLKWFYAKPQQQRIAEIEAPAVLGTDTPPSADYMTAHPWAAGYMDLPKTGTGKSNVVPGFEAQTPQIEKIFLTAFSKVLTENASPTDALNAAQSQAQSEIGG